MDTESGAASREGAIRRKWEERTRVTLAQEEEDSLSVRTTGGEAAPGKGQD